MEYFRVLYTGWKECSMKLEHKLPDNSIIPSHFLSWALVASIIQDWIESMAVKL